MPQVFFNSRHVGGSEEVERMKSEGVLSEGVLSESVRVCLEGGSEGEEFPPPLRTPEPKEYVEVQKAHAHTHTIHTIQNLQVRGLTL